MSPSVVDASSLGGSTTCWEPSLNGTIRNFATISQNNNQINIYSGENSQLLLQLNLPLDLQSKFTSMSWISLNSTVVNEDEKKKKTHKTYILAGTQDGKIIAFDTERGRLVKSIQLSPTTSVSPILNVCCPDGNRIFAALAPNLIAGTHFLSKSNNTKVDLHKICFEDISCLSENCGHLNGADVFAIANSGKTQLFQVNTQQRVCDFQGHENGANQILFIHSDLLLTRSNDDRIVNLYNLSNVMSSSNGGAGGGSLNTSNFIEQLMTTSSNHHGGSSELVAPNKVFTLDANVVAIDGFYRSKKYLDIAAVSHAGLLTLFRVKPASNEKSCYDIVSKAIVKCHLTKGFGKVISARFIDETRIILSMGSPLFPNIQVLDYSSNDKEQEHFLFTEKDLVIDEQPIVAGTKDKLIGSKGSTYSSNMVLGVSNMESANARFAQSLTTGEQGGSQKSFQDILSQTTTSATKKDMTLSEAGVPVMKLNSSLITALKSHDVGMISKCLAHSDFDLIESTVQNLSATFAIKLLDVIIELYGDFSQSRDTLIFWLRSLLVNHTSHIMSQKDIIERLSPIYHSIDSRLRMLPSLMDLSGRLDLLLSIGGYAKVDFDTTDNISAAAKAKAKKFTIVEKDYDSEDEIIEMIQASYNKKSSTTQDDEYDVIDEDNDDRDEEILRGMEDENKKGWFADMNSDDEMSEEERELNELLKREEQVMKSTNNGEDEEDDDDDDEDEVQGDDMQDDEDLEDDE